MQSDALDNVLTCQRLAFQFFRELALTDFVARLLFAILWLVSRLTRLECPGANSRYKIRTAIFFPKSVRRY